MTEFRADCTINLHVESRGKPGKLAWVCSVVHGKRGRVVLARRFMGIASREEVELRALLFGLRQGARFLQEKVDVAANFPLEGILAEGKSAGRVSPELKPMKEEILKAWGGIRLKRVARVAGEEAVFLREEAEKAYQRKHRQDD